MSDTAKYDVIIIGAGMAGASLGAELVAAMGSEASVLLLEMEDQPGYHSTGRSVAFWSETYGGPGVQPLTTASGPWLRNPHPDFSQHGFLRTRGALHIGRSENAHLRQAMMDDFAQSGVPMLGLNAVELKQRLPGLRPDWTIGLSEPSCMDIDVAALHAAYLRAFRKGGGTVKAGFRVTGGQRDGDGWRIDTDAGVFYSAIVANAAGAWADDIARACGVAPIGITPLLRTVVQLRTDPAPPTELPLVVDLAGRFYFKPDGTGRLWLSPHDEIPADPGDVAPDELAVAQAIDRFENVMDWRVVAVERKWAGLRSFAPDRLPVYGHDPIAHGFFWFAGQGGFGIQTAPAAAKLGAALLLNEKPDPGVEGINPELYSPDRFE